MQTNHDHGLRKGELNITIDGNNEYSISNWYACVKCKSHNYIMLTRHMIEKTLCLQLVKCAKCRHE